MRSTTEKKFRFRKMRCDPVERVHPTNAWCFLYAYTPNINTSTFYFCFFCFLALSTARISAMIGVVHLPLLLHVAEDANLSLTLRHCFLFQYRNVVACFWGRRRPVSDGPPPVLCARIHPLLSIFTPMRCWIGFYRRRLFDFPRFPLLVFSPSSAYDAIAHFPYFSLYWMWSDRSIPEQLQPHFSTSVRSCLVRYVKIVSTCCASTFRFWLLLFLKIHRQRVAWHLVDGKS